MCNWLWTPIIKLKSEFLVQNTGEKYEMVQVQIQSGTSLNKHLCQEDNFLLRTPPIADTSARRTIPLANTSARRTTFY
jgi:hypothetical protein